MKPLILILALMLSSCANKRDVLLESPMLDREFSGDYRSIGACVHNEIQLADYTISPSVQFIPGPDYVEIQTTATSALTGTVFGQITKLEKLDDTRFRAVVRAPFTADGDIAISAINKCATD